MTAAIVPSPISWPCSTRSVSSRTTSAAAATASASPSSVTTLPRRTRLHSTWSSSWRRTLSAVPASAAAVSLESSIVRRISPQRLLDEGGHALAVGAPGDLGHRGLHHAAHVLGRARAGLGDGRGDDRAQLVVGQLGRQVGLDHDGLGLLGLGQLRPIAVAERLRGLEAALALTAQDGELVARALLGVLLQLGEHQAQRSDAILLAGLHGRGEIRFDRVGHRHAPTMIGGCAAASGPRDLPRPRRSRRRRRRRP